MATKSLGHNAPTSQGQRLRHVVDIRPPPFSFVFLYAVGVGVCFTFPRDGKGDWDLPPPPLGCDCNLHSPPGWSEKGSHNHCCSITMKGKGCRWNPQKGRNGGGDWEFPPPPPGCDCHRHSPPGWSEKGRHNSCCFITMKGK